MPQKASVLDALRLMTESPDQDRTNIGVSLLNTFNQAVVRLGRREFWTPDDYILFGKATALLYAVQPDEPEQYQPTQDELERQIAELAAQTRPAAPPPAPGGKWHWIPDAATQHAQPTPGARVYDEPAPRVPLRGAPNRQDPYEPNGSQQYLDESYPRDGATPRRR